MNAYGLPCSSLLLLSLFSSTLINMKLFVQAQMNGAGFPKGSKHNFFLGLNFTFFTSHKCFDTLFLVEREKSSCGLMCSSNKGVPNLTEK
jgi:hypothetical protein